MVVLINKEEAPCTDILLFEDHHPPEHCSGDGHDVHPLGNGSTTHYAYLSTKYVTLGNDTNALVF